MGASDVEPRALSWEVDGGTMWSLCSEGRTRAILGI